MTLIAIEGSPAHSRWSDRLKSLWKAYREYRARRRAVAELRRLDPRVLGDLAIDCSEVESVVFNGRGRRRFWAGL